MELSKELLLKAKKLMMIRYPRFASEIAEANIEYKTNLTYKTAATDGKNIYFDPDFFASLSNDNKLFLIAHELLHIKFDHMYRLTDKNGEKRNTSIWNEATDAIINANLERDGFKIMEGCVNRPEALNYTSEEFYNLLFKEKKEQKKNGKNQGQSNQDKNNQQNKNNNNQDYNKKNDSTQNNKNENSENNKNKDNKMTDDHSLWEKAFEDKQEQQCKDENQNQDNNPENNKSKCVDEKSEFDKNRELRKELARNKMTQMAGKGLNSSNQSFNFKNDGEEKAIVDWRILLRREIEKTETIWSQRKSIAENNFAYRLEENDIDDEALTEVLIDTSGSVEDEMIKNFLQQLKPLLKHSKLSVACFDDSFHGFKEIKTNRDIDNFEVVGRWGTNFEMAVKHFSDKREVNKIVFTDGFDRFNLMDKKYANIIWIVYKNIYFSPSLGKVILVDKEVFSNLIKNEQPQFTM